MEKKLKTNDIERFTGMIEAYEDALFTSEAVKVAPSADERYSLKSGGESWIYVDHGDTMLQPETNTPFVDMMTTFITERFPIDKTVLVNILSKSSPQTTGAIAKDGKLRQVGIISEETKQGEKGTNRNVRLPKTLHPDDQFVIVDDVLTSGKTAIESAEAVRKKLIERFDKKVVAKMQFHLVVGLARNPQKAVGNLAQHGITAAWATNLDTIITRAWPQLTETQRSGIREEFPQFANFDTQ